MASIKTNFKPFNEIIVGERVSVGKMQLSNSVTQITS